MKKILLSALLFSGVCVAMPQKVQAQGAVIDTFWISRDTLPKPGLTAMIHWQAHNFVGDMIMTMNGNYPLHITQPSAKFPTDSLWETTEFALTAYGADGNHVTKYYKVVVLGATSVPRTTALTLQVFPNPATAFLTIEGLPPSTPFAVYDMQGKVMATAITEGSQTKIDVSSYPQGLYTIVLPGATQKFLKQ